MTSELESKSRELAIKTDELKKSQIQILAAEQEKKNVAERLFETEMNFDMMKEQHDNLSRNLEEALNQNHDLRIAQASRGSPVDSGTQHGLLKQIQDLRAENDNLRRSVNQSDNDLISAESNLVDDQLDSSNKLVDKLKHITKQNEELKEKSETLSQQLIDAMALTSSTPVDIDSLRNENKALRQTLDEMNKQLLGVMTGSSPSSSTTSGARTPNHANHQLQMIKLENQGLHGEIKRLKLMLEHIEEDSPHQTNSRYTPVSHKMLEDQIDSLNQENIKLKAQNAKAAMESDRVKQIEERTASAREEASNLKTRVFYLEDQIRSLHSQQVEKDRAHDAMVQRLREQVKVGDAKSPTNFGVAQSPQLGPSSTRNTDSQGFDQGSSELAREKKALESSLAKAERDLRTRDTQIADLSSQVMSLSSEIERLRAEVSGRGPLSYSDRGASAEVQRMRERVSILEERERHLIESEVEKEKRIRLLEEHVAKIEGEDSLRFE